MLTLLACALTVAQVPIDQPQRLRTLLPNGSAILVEQVPKSKTLSVQLFVSARGGGTFAQRHLLEHLAALGTGTLDTRLESEGAFLRPQTYRDATVFAIQLPPQKLALGISALQEIIAQRAYTQEQIDREQRAIQQESELRDDTSAMSEALWAKAYGKDGLGPFEDIKVSAAEVAKLQNELRSPANLVLVVAGDVDLDATTAKGKELLASLAKGTEPPAVKRKPNDAGRTSASAVGNAIAAPVAGYRAAGTAATLTAALAAASEIAESYVIYTPASQDGLVILGSRSDASVRDLVGRMKAEELFGQAKILGQRWVSRQLSGAASAGFSRGLLIVQERDLRPEVLIENIDAMTLTQFRAGLESLTGDASVLATGRGPSAMPETKNIEPPKLIDAPATSGVVEIVTPAEDQIAFHALLELPALTALERRILSHVVRAILRGTAEYPRREMLQITNGSPVEAVLAPDHVRISFTAPSVNLSSGLALMDSLLRQANLRDEDLASNAGPPDAWSLALSPISYRLDKLPSEKAREVYQRVFRPERVLLTVAGKFAPGAAKAAWNSRMSAWQPPRILPARDDYSMTTVFTGNFSGVTTIDIAAPLVPKSADLYPRLLALFALGSGKGSSLFQVVRQQLGVSYRQEAVLSSTLDGLETRLLIAATPTSDENARVAQIKAALLKDIDGWTEANRKRAVGMASAALIEGTERGPFYLSGSSPAGSDLAGRTLLAAYWQMKVGGDWDATTLLTNMKDVSLGELKDAAKAIVAGEARVLKG